MTTAQNGYDFSDAVGYHYGGFPPRDLDLGRLIQPLSSAVAALARYDQMLISLHNSEVLLAPLVNQEAVVSSRMEGTISTLDEILRVEADQEEETDTPKLGTRNEALEVLSYQRALRQSQTALEQGADLNDWLLRNAHQTLLRWTRGAGKAPGDYKTEQNYISGRTHRKIAFVPIRPENLRDGMEALFQFNADPNQIPLLKAAISHVEFEALHPFQDGNGRIGRMLVTLLLWRHGAISKPHFYISEYLENVRDEYIDRMRAVSAEGAWTEWCTFFLEAMTRQAELNMEKAKAIQELYDEMKLVFRDLLTSAYHITALDFMFTNPVFRNNRFTSRSGIPFQIAQRFSKTLSEEGYLHTLVPAAGRRPALYSFEPLLQLVRI